LNYMMEIKEGLLLFFGATLSLSLMTVTSGNTWDVGRVFYLSKKDLLYLKSKCIKN